MKSVVGIFAWRIEAVRGIQNLRTMGIGMEKLYLLTPESSEAELNAVPTTESEPAGAGKAMGGVVGAALGLGGGLSLGAAVASVMLPGAGMILVAGGAALLGVVGLISGTATAEALEDDIWGGIPIDEVYLLRDALRQGRSVVIAFVEDWEHEAAIGTMKQSGAESIDPVEDDPLFGSRDVTDEHYVS